MAIATFNLSNQPNTGINLNGTLGGGGNIVQNSAPTSNQYLLSQNPDSNPDATTNRTTVTTTPTAAADLSSYDQGIASYNNQINNLTPALNNLLQGANNNYQTTLNGLLQQKSSTDQQYHTSKTNDAQDYNGAKNTIRTNTGSTISGVDRLLGARGGGGQAAGDYAALLAGKAGTQQLSGAGDNFGKNEQGLDTNYGNFMNAYNQNYTNAGLQHDADVNNAQANINTQKANLLQQLATLTNQRTAAAGGSGVGASQGYIDQANQLMADAARLGAPKPVAAQTPMTYTAPTLASYVTNPTTISAGGQTAATDSVTPFLTTLLNRQKQDDKGTGSPAQVQPLAA